jgi:hypothetical protein
MFSPPEMITSLRRSRSSTYPSGCMTARSPAWNQPPRKASAEASGSLDHTPERVTEEAHFSSQSNATVNGPIYGSPSDARGG